MALLPKVVCAVDQHAPATAGGVIDRITRLRLQDAHERVHDLGWCEKLARFCSSIIGELLNEIFVRTAQHIRRNTGIRKIVGVEMLDKGVHHLVWYQGLATTI